MVFSLLFLFFGTLSIVIMLVFPFTACFQPSWLNHRPVVGPCSARARIVKHYKNRYGVDVDEDGVMVTTGSSAAFVLGFIAAFGPGDRVAIATPGKARIEKKYKKYKSKRKKLSR